MEKAQGDPKKVSDKDIFTNEDYRQTFLGFLRTVRKEPILDMSGKQLLRRMTADAKERFEQYHDKERGDCHGCPNYPGGCISCYMFLPPAMWKTDLKKKGKRKNGKGKGRA